MKSNSRKTESDINQINHPRSPKNESSSPQELRQRVLHLLSDKEELQGQVAARDQLVEDKARLAEEKAQEAEKTHHLFLAEQQRYQSTLTLYQKSEEKYKSTVILYKDEQQRRQSVMFEFQEVQTQSQSYFTLYQEAQVQSQSYLTMYQGEKVKGNELTIKFEEVEGSRDRYLTLYNESQLQLKTERKSKAGIKGWETRRKKENAKLKKEISEMAIIIRDSMERKDEAINSLYAVAERMDRIQQMVELVDDDTTATNPIGMMKKLQRMWQAIKEVLAE